MFVGLLKGEHDEWVMTWPKGKQQLRLTLANDSLGQRVFESVDFDNDGQSLYLATLSAPGIWHREVLKPTYLEKEVTLTWKRPFAAKWKTQLTEGEFERHLRSGNRKGRYGAACRARIAIRFGSTATRLSIT